MLENYLVYLQLIDEKLNKFFTKQKPFIYCKKGCGLCCKNAQFPYSQIELEYLMIGVRKLDEEKKSIISQNINKLKQQKAEHPGKDFKYDCPFLINNECSVYNYRGIICRSFGLLNISAKGKIRVPFCCFQGLNYSNVMDDCGTKISEEKYRKLNVEEEPLAFNTSYEFLTDPDFATGFHFDFNEKKPLINWFIEEDNKEEIRHITSMKQAS